MNIQDIKNKVQDKVQNIDVEELKGKFNNLDNQAKALIGVGLLGTGLIVGGVANQQPNQCEALMVDNTEILELATDYVEASDNFIVLGATLNPLLAEMNSNNLEMRRNDCQGNVRDRYITAAQQASYEYERAVKTRYPFMTNWF